MMRLPKKPRLQRFRGSSRKNRVILEPWLVLAFVCGLLLSLGAAPVRGADPSDVQVIPPDISIQLKKVPPSMRKGLPELLSLDHEGRAKLAARDDAAVRCRAIYAASYHGDLGQLIEWSFLLDDHRPGLPVGHIGDGLEGGIENGEWVPYYQYFVGKEPITVSEFMTSTYGIWFGIRVRTQEEAKKAFPEMPPLDKLIQPWVTRLIQAGAVGGQAGVLDKDTIQAKIDVLPPEVKWAVVTRCEEMDLYSSRQPGASQQARDMITALPASVLTGLEQGKRFLSQDPQFKNHPEREDKLRQRCLKILSDATQSQ